MQQRQSSTPGVCCCRHRTAAAEMKPAGLHEAQKCESSLQQMNCVVCRFILQMLTCVHREPAA